MQNCLAVILAAGRGSRMYPLTEGCPKCLLPVANRPLIWYPVQLLERRGFQGELACRTTWHIYRLSPYTLYRSEAVVVVREAESREVSEALNQLVSGGGLAFSLVPIPDSEDWGTADSLRHLRGKLKVRMVEFVLLKKCACLFPSHSIMTCWLSAVIS